jgi:Transglutaminase-like superfamily
MMRKLQQFVALPWRQKSVFLQAWLLLGWMRAAILTTSFKYLARKLEHHRSPPIPTAVNLEQVRVANHIGKLVAVAAKYTPWQSLCLTQVLVVQRLLSRRGIAGQFYLGVRRGCELTDDPTGLSAHAWLQCGEYIVNGAAGHERFTVVSTFSWDAGRG